MEPFCQYKFKIFDPLGLNEKEKYFKGEITIGHCKGHGCIILFLILKDFTKTIDDCGQNIFILDKTLWVVVVVLKSITYTLKLLIPSIKVRV